MNVRLGTLVWLRWLTFGDPADRVIVATSRVHARLLATHNGAIRRSRVARLWKPATTLNAWREARKPIFMVSCKTI